MVRGRKQAKLQRAADPPRSSLVSLWDWRKRNSHIFPSDTSLRWHLRQNGQAYRASGALKKIAGRFFCDPQLMESTMREVGGQVAESQEAA